LDWLNEVVAMLAQILMVRLEAAARLQEQTASLSSSRLVPLAPSNQFLFSDNTARPVDRSGGRLEMGKSHKSDWPVLFFGLLFVGSLLSAFMPSSVKAQQPPLREGCRAVSKLEYDTAKREYILISRGGRYVQTGYFWRRHYWWCHV
jgi:hypothetical protein